MLYYKPQYNIREIAASRYYLNRNIKSVTKRLFVIRRMSNKGVAIIKRLRNTNRVIDLRRVSEIAIDVFDRHNNCVTMIMPRAKFVFVKNMKIIRSR